MGPAEERSLKQLADRLARRWAKFRRQEYQPEKTKNWLAGLFNAADLLLAGGWRGPLLGAVLNVAFDMLTLYFLFIAAGHRISLGMLLTGYGLPLLLGKMAFMVPGGVGIVESTMTGLYASLGVPNAVTVVVVLTYRVLSFWLPLLLGFPMIFCFCSTRTTTRFGTRPNKANFMSRAKNFFIGPPLPTQQFIHQRLNKISCPCNFFTGCAVLDSLCQSGNLFRLGCGWKRWAFPGLADRGSDYGFANYRGSFLLSNYRRRSFGRWFVCGCPRNLGTLSGLVLVLP